MRFVGVFTDQAGRLGYAIGLKNIVVNCLICFGSLVICLTFLEIGIRVFELTPDIFLQEDDLTGLWHIPNKEGVYFRKDIPKTRIKINAEGLRDDEYSHNKPENTYRIAVLGDSFTQAIHVPLEATYQQLLERKLNAATSSQAFEVINFGVGGFSTTHEYLTFKYRVLKYHPDLVLLAFMLGNDIFENSPVLNGRKYLPYFVLGEQNDLVYIPPEPVPFYMKLGASLKMIPFFYYRIVDGNATLERFLRGIRRGSPDKIGIPYEYYEYAARWDSEWKTAWEITKAVLSRLQQACLAEQIELIVFGIPDQIQVDADVQQEVLATYPAMANQGNWDWEKPNRLVQEFCQAAGIFYRDLTPQFKAQIQQGVPPLYYRYDGHWNQNGHRLAVECLYRILREKLLYLHNL